MKKMNRWLQRCKAAGKTFLAAFAVFLLNTQTAYASGISESKLAKGTEKLIGDATTWLMVLAPVVAGLLIIYFCIIVLWLHDPAVCRPLPEEHRTLPHYDHQTSRIEKGG